MKGFKDVLSLHLVLLSQACLARGQVFILELYGLVGRQEVQMGSFLDFASPDPALASLRSTSPGPSLQRRGTGKGGELRGKGGKVSGTFFALNLEFQKGERVARGGLPGTGPVGGLLLLLAQVPNDKVFWLEDGDALRMS